MTKARQIFLTLQREGADEKDLMRELRRAHEEWVNSSEDISFLNFLEE